MNDNDLFRRMKEKAESVQAIVTEVPDPDAVFRYAAELAARQGGRFVAAPGLSEEQRILLAGHCEGQGLELLSGPLRDHPRGIHAAVTSADWGIAETGTLVFDSASEDFRLATMLAEIHVAFLERSRIRGESADVEVWLDGRMKSPPCYAAFVTGASRTADIERVLTIGVHGPRELHICITEES